MSQIDDDLNSESRESKWKRELRYDLKNKVMNHYLHLFKKSDFLVELELD